MKPVIYMLILMMAFCGCKTPDKDIHADIAGKAKEDLNFAGLQYTVDNGVVNVTGNCPSLDAFKKVKQKMSNIHVVKAVNYNVTIAPVVMDMSTPVKSKVDSILSNYPQVMAVVNPSEVTLKGKTTLQKKYKLITELAVNNIAFVKDSLDIQY